MSRGGFRGQYEGYAAFAVGRFSDELQIFSRPYPIKIVWE